jgi:hypothetical protein
MFVCTLINVAQLYFAVAHGKVVPIAIHLTSSGTGKSIGILLSDFVKQEETVPGERLELCGERCQSSLLRLGGWNDDFTFSGANLSAPRSCSV